MNLPFSIELISLVNLALMTTPNPAKTASFSVEECSCGWEGFHNILGRMGQDMHAYPVVLLRGPSHAKARIA